MEPSQLRAFSGIFHPASKSIPLEKYSSAVSREGSRSHRWVHDTRKDLLTLIFKPVDILIDDGRTETHLFMAVTAGRDTLEQLDVQKLAKWFQEYNERVHRGLIGRDVESPVQVKVRYPAIALRYPGTTQMVRRFQLRFKDNKQYSEALNILKRAGLSVEEYAQGPKQDGHSQGHVVANNRSIASLPTQPAPVDRPDNHQKAQFSVPSYESSQRFTQFANNSSVPPRSDTSSSLSMRPPSTFSEDLGGLRSSSSVGISYKDIISSDDFCFQPPPPRPFSSASLIRSSPPIFASQVETQQGATLTSGQRTETPSDMVEPRKEQGHIAAPSHPLLSEVAPRVGCDSLAKSPELPDIKQPPRGSTESLATQPPPDGSTMKRSSTSTQLAPGLNWGYDNEHMQPGRQSSLSFSTTRPMSAPTVVDDLHLSQWIPPKRELPFPKSKVSKKTLETTQNSKESSENASMLQYKDTGVCMNPKNTQTLPSKYGAKQSKRAAMRGTNTPPTSKLSTVAEVPDSDEETGPTNVLRNSALWEEEPSPLASKSAAIVRPSTAPGLKQKAINTHKRSNEVSPKWALAKRVKMVDSSTQTQTLSGRDHTAAISRASTITVEPVLPAAVTDPAPEPVLPAPVSSPGPPPPNAVSEAIGPIEGFMDEHDRFIPKYGGNLRPAELWEVSAWDKATSEERHSMTETWICEQIEDPEFIEMCKHVDSVWKKLGLKT